MRSANSGKSGCDVLYGLFPCCGFWLVADFYWLRELERAGIEGSLSETGITRVFGCRVYLPERAWIRAIVSACRAERA
jgi:hypothetical protein